MNKLLKDRIKLIRGMQKAAFGNENENSFLKVIVTIRKDEKKHFLSYSQEITGQVSYAEKPEHRLDSNRRVRTTLGRYFRRQLGISQEEINDKVLLEVTREISARLSEGIQNIRIISGSKIVDAYCESCGGSSCMTGDNADKTWFYADNPDVVSMVVYGNSEARALLWKTEQGVTVMDRIYPNDGPHVNVLRNWAASNGYVWRCNNSLPDGDVELSDGNSYTVTLSHHNRFPYMDTFSYGKISGRKITLSNASGFASAVLQNTCGSYSNATYCHSCGESIRDDDSYTGSDGNYYCEGCFHDIFRYCDRCNEVTYIEDCDTVNGTERWCPSCRENHAYLCDDCSKWYTDIVTAEDTGENFCKDCASDNLHVCEECECCYASELHECDDEKFRCDECHGKYEEDKLKEAV